MPKKRKTIKPVTGWVLIDRDGDGGGWHICWHEVFGRKREAIEFAKKNNWPPGYRATRGAIIV